MRGGLFNFVSDSNQPQPFMYPKSSLFCAALSLLAACAAPRNVEVGPYTVSVIEKNVWHIQDFNRSNPAGEAFDEGGNKTHFNNCSDIYLIVGEQEALVIDLSNPITWADNAPESLRAIISERAAGKPVTVTFTHSHGDHTGMLPAMLDLPGVRFALPQADFARFADRIPEERREWIREGKVFDLGGLQVETIAVPGHTPGSVAYLLLGHDCLFTGDAIGSGHGVWIFNEDGFYSYVSAVPHLMETLRERGVNEKRLQIYGGHYWQRDWLSLPRGREMGWDYLTEMKALLDGMESGTAAKEASGLDHPVLDTYFRNGNAIVVWNAAQAEAYRARTTPSPSSTATRTWSSAASTSTPGRATATWCTTSPSTCWKGTRKPLSSMRARRCHLDRAVAALTGKPVIMAVTHGHGDHVGGVVCFPEVWIHPEDEPMITGGRTPYAGTVRHLQDGQVIDLGGRQVQVLHTPGHTSGSVTFFDNDRHVGFSGDAFGSTNLLLFAGTLRGLIETNTRTLDYMRQHGITQLYPGHYHGDNPETAQRLEDEIRMAREVLSGKRKGQVNEGNPQLNRFVFDYGVHIRYRDPEALK